MDVHDLVNEQSAASAAGFRPKKRSLARPAASSSSSSSSYFQATSSNPSSPLASPDDGASAAAAAAPAADAAEEVMDSPEFSHKVKKQKKQRAVIVISSDEEEEEEDDGPPPPQLAAADIDDDALLNIDMDAAFAQSKNASAAPARDDSEEERQLAAAMRNSEDSSEDVSADMEREEEAQLAWALERSEAETDVTSQTSISYYEPGSTVDAPAAASASAFYKPPSRGGGGGASKQIPVGRRSVKPYSRPAPKPRDGGRAAKAQEVITLDSGEEEEEELADSDLDDDDDEDDSDEEVAEDDVSDRLLASCESVADELKRKLQESMSGYLSGSGATSESQLKKAGLVMQPPNVGSETLRLKPYQLIGLNWMYMLYKNNYNGILGDEMGLGKTVQATALIGQLHNQGDVKPTIVVAPASVLENWEREVTAWLPSAWVMKYHGSQKERHAMRDELKQARYNGETDRLVLICAYTLFQSDSSDSKSERKFLNKMSWSYCILDEGHSIKNSQSKRYKRLSQLECRNKLLLTGTPIQNNPQEIFSILHFLLPKLFTEERMLRLTDEAPDMNSAVAKVRRLMAPFIIRRLKSEVSKNDEFCIKNEEFCIINDEFRRCLASWCRSRRKWKRLRCCQRSGAFTTCENYEFCI